MMTNRANEVAAPRPVNWVERVIAIWLSFVIVAHPLAVHATDVRPADGNTTLDQSANGTRIVNIATPSASGLSHNRYGTFNVSDQGVILNNSREVVRTDIGGYIDANPHLTNGSARLILNEVTSRNPSSLLGPIEVGGRRADVVIANPNGITCDGCGFINTVRGTLTTGTPQWADGALTGFDVRGGSVAFEGAGASMQGASRFDVLAGVIRLNAEIQGRELNLLAGHHQVDYSDLSLTANGATPSEPVEFAISSSSFGGIYGDRIRLIANDAGVGVHLDAPVAAQLGNVEISADGTVRYSLASAIDSVKVTAQNIVADGAATAGNRLDLIATDQIHLNADTAEARRIHIEASHLNIGENAALTGRLLNADLGSLDNQGVIRADVTSITTEGELRNQGVMEGRHLTLTAANLNNAQGSIAATGNLKVSVDDYRHQGEVQASHLTLNSGSDILLEANSDWRLAGSAELNAVGQVRNEGILSTASTLTITAAGLVNDGDLAARGALSLQAETVDNLTHSLILAESVNIETDRLFNAGDLYAISTMVIAGLSSSHVETLLNRSGLIGTLVGDINLDVNHLVNDREGEYSFVPKWNVTGERWPSDWNESCFNNNFESGCKANAYRDTLRHEYIPDEQIAEVARQGVILAGRDLTLDGRTLDNYHSLFGAHGNMTLTVTERISNDALVMNLRDEVYTDRSRYREGSRNSGGGRNKYIYSTIPYSEDPAFCSRDKVRCGQDQWAIARVGEDIPTVILSAVLGAGGTLNASTDVLGNGTHGEGLSLAAAASYLSGDGLPETTELYRLDPITTGGFSLPGQYGLFVLNTNAGHPFLIETNSLFASYTGFMGSAYMLDRLGWNPEPGLRLLGDSFYELNLLQNALIGQPVLAGATQEEREQFFTLMMDQGVAAAESLQLALGVSLTADQINALQSDIIWLEEREVAGYKVLVPVVYLANGIQAPDAVIAGQSVILDAGSITSGGTIRAQDELTATANDGSLVNTGSMLAGNSLTLTASEDIINRSGVISGHDVTLTAGGDIVNETIFSHLSDNGHHYTALGNQAYIGATGTLTLDSGKDVHISGGEISAESLKVLAAGNIRVDTIEVRRSYNMDRSSNSRLDRLTHLSSEITSILDMLLSAQQDIELAGARLTGGADVTLFAGNDLRIEAVEDRYYSYVKEKTSSTFSSKTVITEEKTSDQIGTQIYAGGQLTLEAKEGEVALLASVGHGEQGVSVSAGTDVRIESGINSEYHRTQTINKNAARVKTNDTGSNTETLAMAGLSSGGDLSINAEGNVHLNAGMLVAQDTLRIGDATIATDELGAMLKDEEGNLVIERGSVSNITLGTVELNNSNWNETTRSLRGPVKELAKVAATTLGVGAFILPELALVDSAMDITLSSKESDRTDHKIQVGSQLIGSDILLAAQDTITLTGATLMADEEQGSVVALADKILLDTAVTETTHTVIAQEESAAGIGPSLSKDEVGLGGLELTDHTATTTTKTVTHTGTSITGNQILLQADSIISLINADITATGEDGSLTLDSQAVIVTGIQDTHEVTHAEKTEVTTVTVGVRNAYVDAAYAVKALKDAGEEVDRARRALSEAERAYDRGEISAGARDDYRAMLAMATANLVQADLAAGQALAAGAAGVAAGGTGFYVSGSAQHSETSSTSIDTQKVWQGSTLSAANMSITADVASIIGSQVNAETLTLDADSILLGAGTNSQSSSFEQDSKSVGGSMSTSGAGSWSANVGYNEASSSSEATQHVNTQLNVGHLNSTSDTLTLKGAVVTANTANIITDTLTVESLQDTHSSKNSSWGANIGTGGGMDSVGNPQSGSGGANFASGNSEGAITNEQSAILIGSGADSQITANHTNLIGGMIANASWEVPQGAEEGTAPVLVDHGQLNFTTNTLTVEDLRDYSRSSQSGGGIQTGFGIGQYSGDNKEHYVGTGDDKRGKDYLSGSTTLSVQSEGHRMEGETRATIGGGNIIVGGVSLDQHADFVDLNRDIDKAQETTLDQQTGALNASVSVDHRWLSSTGRQVIKDDHVNLKDNAKEMVGGVTGDLARIGTVVGGVFLEAGQVGSGLAHIDGNQGVAYAEEGKLAGDIEGIRKGDVEDAVYAQDALNRIDDYFQSREKGEEGSRVKVTEGAFSPDGNSVAGAANVGSDTMYIDLADPHRNSLMRTFTEESMHLAGAGDPMAGYVGWLGDLTYRVNAWANSGNISQHHAVVPVQNWAAHNQLLTSNHNNFVRDAANNELQYRQIETAEIRAIRDFVPIMTDKLGGTDAENERRLAQTLVGLLDQSWADYQQSQGQERDAEALAMLSEALLPLADKYAPAPPASDVPMLPSDIDALTATSAEQLQQHLLGYSENHPRSYADRTAGDDDFGKAFSLQTGFYDQNFGGNDPWFNYEGVGGASVGLFDTGAGILNGLAYAISNPGEALEAMFLGTHQLVFDTPGFIGDINAAHNQAQLNAYLDYLQGDYFSSAYTSTMGDLTFGMEWAGLIPANRTWQLGRLGGDVVPNKTTKDYGVAFFGEDNLGYYTRGSATIGREGKTFFFMPLEDSAAVRNAADAARYTGRAPSAEKAYLSGGDLIGQSDDIFGLSFPTNGMKVTKPTAADAGGWPHYLEGGHTAIKTGDGPNAGYLVNPTREFVVPGGNAVPEGSVLFKLGPNGEWVPIRSF